MKSSEATIRGLESELDTARNQLAEQDTTWRSASEQLENQLDQATADRDKAVADLEEAQTNIEDLSTALTRSEKGKSTMQQTIDIKEKELSILRRKFDALEKDYKSSRNEIADLKKSLAKQKQQYDTVKTRSLVQDLEKIKSLESRLRDSDKDVIKAQKVVKEKEDLLASTKARMQRLQDERNEDLQQMGRLQEELAEKDLQLSNARAASGSIEAVRKMAERERESATQKASQEMEMLRRNLVLVKKLAEDREKETLFFKDAMQESEKKTAELESRLEMESNLVKKRDDDAAVLKTSILGLKTELAVFKNYRQSAEEESHHYEQKAKLQQELLEALQRKVDAFNAVEQKQLQGQEAVVALRRRIDEMNASLHATSNEPVHKRDVHREERIKDELLRTTLEVLNTLEKNNDLQHNAQDVGQDQIESEITRWKRTAQEAEEQRDSLKVENEALRSSMEKLSFVKTESEEGTTLSEVVLDLNRTLAIITALEELVLSLEEEIEQMKRSREEMTTVDETLRQTILEIEFEKTHLTEKMTKLERDLGRREQDLKIKSEELEDSKAKLLEVTSRGDTLDEQLQSLQHQRDLLEQSHAEQKQQLEGRERALKRLEQARTTYDKVYESRIESLKEEIATVEKLSQTEWEKLLRTQKQETQTTIDQCMMSINEAQRSHVETCDKLKGERLVMEEERNGLKTELENLKESLEGALKEIDDRHILITGYMALVSQQEGEGMLPEGSEALRGLIQQNQDHLTTIDNQNQHIQVLRKALDEQAQIINQSNLNTDTLANKQETYLRQISELESQLSKLKTARMKEQAHFKTLLSTKESEVQTLERELGEKMDAWRRKEAALKRSAPAAEASNTSEEPMPPTSSSSSS
ncbi:hypothetical protein BGX28_007873 [Mortierella sp. GBA30]|nr:hypothetical protein BGX28_007873 [Mortierella sp. GBA30]